ncbi:MAG: hypothetical protein M3Y54_16280, partial [Bacteroidota bacterium]|nr:hypothetical protein [Bacteroidota bacterium]
MTNFFSPQLLTGHWPVAAGLVARARGAVLFLLLALLPLLARAGTPVLSFQATVPVAAGVDVTAFVEQVEILNASTGAVVAGAVRNASFETFTAPLGGGTYGYNPGGTSWAFDTGSGVAANGSAFNPPTTANGSYVAFLQTGSSLASAFSQTLPALPAGTYQVRVLLGQRNRGNANQGVAVLVDGREVGRSVPANDNAYHSYTTAAFVVDAVLRLEATGSATAPNADVTAFVDAVTLLDAGTGAAVPGTPVANASFETFTSLSNGSYGYRPAGATWAFVDYSGIAASASPFGNPGTSPAGNYVAFLQSSGGTGSSFSQVLPAALSGTSQVRLQLAQRNTAPANQGVRVYLNNVLIGTFVPGNIGVFQPYTTGSYAVATHFVTGFSPGSGPAGTSVVITGNNFTGATAVVFNGTNAPGFVVNAAGTQITVSVPAGATSGPVSVTNGATATSAASFNLEYWMSPAAITTCSGTLFDPAGPGDYSPGMDKTTTLTPATAGAKVRLTFGSWAMFGADLYIYDGPNTNARLIGQFNTGRPGTVTATTAAGQLTVRFFSDFGGGVVDHGFDAAISCVTGTPDISSFTPTSGASGTSVVITGTNFTGATGVSFNGTGAPGFVVNAAGTQITVAAPVGATPGPIFVTTAIGTGSSSSNFTPSPPTISSFSPVSGSSGTSVVLTGLGFTGATDITFNGMTTRTYVGSTTVPNFTVNSNTQITVAVPTGATTGPIRVTTPNGTGTSATSFVTDNFWFSPAITSCTGTLYNPGGPGGGYGAPDATTTLTPATAGGKVRLTFAPNGGLRNIVV